MKERILSQLYGISHGLSDSKAYVEKLKESDKIQSWYYSYRSQQQKTGQKALDIDVIIRENCQKALSLMIHDFHRFRIETIDSFFQSVIRELAHDLDLTANLNVELDNASALREGVIKLIDSIVTDQEIKKHVLQYVSDKMSDSRNWRIDSDLETFGKNIFNEHYMEYSERLRERLSEPGFLSKYKSDITKHLNDSLSQTKSLAIEMDSELSSAGLTPDDFYQKGKGVYAYIQKVAQLDLHHPNLPNINSYVVKAIDDLDGWSKDSNVASIVESHDMPRRLQELTSLHQSSEILLKTVSVIGKHLNNLALINTINDKVNEVTGERNDFLLANTNHFLHSMIEGSDVPFVYERTGSHFDHIMIDEFQDTSLLQWENFKPLLKNSLDAGKDCLLVGDVKQSIYRWRGGEWSILNELDHDPLLGSQVHPTPLKQNFRSKSNIIQFNNDFFALASKLIRDDFVLVHDIDFDSIVNAYSDCRQELGIPSKQEGGYVRVELMGLSELSRLQSQSSDISDNDDDISTSVGNMSPSTQWNCERLASNITSLLSQGLRQEDICILIRKNKLIPIICDYFAQNVFDSDGSPIRIVSNEAYKLDRSDAVQMLITGMKVLNSPDDRSSLALLAYRYQSLQSDVSPRPIGLDRLLLLQPDEIRRYLPAEFSPNGSLSMVPLYELCERLYSLLCLEKLSGQDSFLYFFFDKLSEYLGKYPSDIDSFLKYWDTKLSGLTLNSGSSSGIQIMTIHKSKGLEFHTVIVPFCDWELHDSRNASKQIIWCEPQESPFDTLPVCPINMDKSSGSSIFKPNYDEELKKEAVDNLNLVYVAFTRASSNLIIQSSPKDSSSLAAYNASHSEKNKCKGSKVPKGEIKSIYDVLVKSLDPIMDHHTSDELRGEYYEFSSTRPMPPDENGDKNTENVLLSKPSIIPTPFRSYSSRGEFRQSNDSRRFVSGEYDEINNKYQSEGLIFHEILSRIRTIEDVERSILRLDHEGCFASSTHRADVRRLVMQAFSSPQCAYWFDPHWTVVNEQCILFKDDAGRMTSRRPDRVIYDSKETIVIDYKTGMPSEDHLEQVRRYKELLEEMGHKNVKGYLWYIRRGEVVRV